jgi:solute carrier family 10 (sodium/bile acid cotransporter), member 7
MKFKFDWFLKGMLVAVGLAFLWPAPGAHGGFLHPELLNKAGIALIFFLNGLGLSLLALRDGALRWQVHLLIQASTFLIFPLLGWGLIKLSGGWMSVDLQDGFFYLCALPSTVSSSVAFTVAARGNVPAAMFNATLSSLIGVVLTPLWMAWILGQSGAGFAVAPVIIDLLLWLVLPLVLGQFARPLLGAWASRNRTRVQMADRLIILTLVYTSFSDSVQQGIWSRYSAMVLVETIVGACVLFCMVLLLTRALSNLLGLSTEDRIAAIFCGSKKTMASGVPMAHLIFGANPALGLILMPIMVYHPLQLAVGGVIAQHWANRKVVKKSSGAIR